MRPGRLNMHRVPVSGQMQKTVPEPASMREPVVEGSQPFSEMKQMI